MRPAAVAALGLALAGCRCPFAPESEGPGRPVQGAAFAGSGVRTVGADPREKRLRNLRQVTFEGENAEAYWSHDGSRLTFQHRGEGIPADQIYSIRADGTDLRLVSTGTGKTTCSFYMPGDDRVIFASTHGASPEPPPPPDMSRGYVWPIYPDYDLFVAGPGPDEFAPLVPAPGYDAEAVVSPDGRRIVFTSMRSGDLDLWTMDLDGSNLRQVTRAEGYEGGAFFSPDSKRLVYRSWHPESPEKGEDYRSLLGQGLIRPLALQIRVCDADGSNVVHVTDNGRANFGPFFHPDGERIIFSSNLDDPKGREFDLYMIRADGTGLERITFSPDFDGFPMFSPDGRTLAFCSNRLGAKRGETNVFLADWVE